MFDETSIKINKIEKLHDFVNCIWYWSKTYNIDFKFLHVNILKRYNEMQKNHYINESLALFLKINIIFFNLFNIHFTSSTLISKFSK